jgi:hypothetical protein
VLTDPKATGIAKTANNPKVTASLLARFAIADIKNKQNGYKTCKLGDLHLGILLNIFSYLVKEFLAL